MWIKLEIGFFTHIKTKRLRKIIGDPAYWVPIRIWTFCAATQQDGDLSKYTHEEIAEEIGYPPEHADKLVHALVEVGFLDCQPLRVHEWAEHNKYHTVNADRAAKAAAARWAKNAPSMLGAQNRQIDQKEEKSPTPPKEDKEEDKEESRVASMLKHNEHDAQACSEHARAQRNGFNGVESEKTNGFTIDRPTKSHFISHADRIGFPAERAEMLWNLLENSEWKDSKGQTIRNWKAKLGYAHSDWVEKGRPKLKSHTIGIRGIGEVGHNGEVIEW